MTKDIEVEVSGPLDEVQRIQNFLDKNGKKTNVKHRVLIDYSTFLDDGLRNRKKDIRLRITNGTPEIIVKLGDWTSSNHRKELSVFTEKGSFDRLVQIYAALGYTKGMLCERITQVYEYDGIEFALVEIPGHSFHFEAEIMASSDDVERARRHIEETCNKLGLKIFSDDEYMDYIETLNKEANEVFDYNDYEDGYFERRYHFSKEKQWHGHC